MTETNETNIENKQDNKIGIAMLVGTILSCFIGVWLLGEIYTQGARILLGLSDEKLESIIVEVIILMIIAIIGTIIFIAAFSLKNKKIRLTIILFSVLIPTILEVIDLTIRSILIYNEIASNPELLLSLI